MIHVVLLLLLTIWHPLQPLFKGGWREESRPPTPPPPTHGRYSGVKIEGIVWVELSFEGLVQIQDVNPRNVDMGYETHIKVCAWSIRYMFRVRCEGLRINHLTPLLVVTMPSYACWLLWRADLYLRTSNDVFIFKSGLRFEGLFGERYVYVEGRAKSHLKGHIEDFQSRTLAVPDRLR